MKKTSLSCYILGLILAVSTVAEAVVIQTFMGPQIDSGGGEGTLLIDTNNDTDDWISTLNGGGTIYLSFDWNITDNAGETGTVDGGFFGGLGIYDGSTERLLIGNGWQSLQYGAGQGEIIENTGIDYVVGDTAVLVVQLDINNDGSENDSWRLWVNPSNGDQATPSALRTDWTLDNFTRLTHRAGDGSGSATLSNLIIASAWDDVAPPAAVPEPSTALPMLLLVVCALWKRKRD